MTQDELAEIGRLALAAKRAIVDSEWDAETSRCPECSRLAEYSISKGRMYITHGHYCAWAKLVAKIKEVKP